jgi:hypothetical protein
MLIYGSVDSRLQALSNGPSITAALDTLQTPWWKRVWFRSMVGLMRSGWRQRRRPWRSSARSLGLVLALALPAQAIALLGGTPACSSRTSPSTGSVRIRAQAGRDVRWHRTSGRTVDRSIRSATARGTGINCRFRASGHRLLPRCGASLLPVRGPCLSGDGRLHAFAEARGTVSHRWRAMWLDSALVIDLAGNGGRAFTGLPPLAPRLG